MTNQQQAQRGLEASQVLDNPAYRAAMDALRAEVVEAWKKCPVRDKEGALLLLQLAKMADKFESILVGMLENGKFTQRKIEMDELRDEVNETATLTVAGTAGTLTITDDDAAPTLTGTASSTVTAGDPVVITYSPGLSGQSRTYTLALTDGTAVGGTDYDNTTVTGDFAVTAGTGSVTISGSTVTVSAGVTAFTLTIGTTA